MHISSLDPGLFGDTSSFGGWDLSNEYTAGGETYRLWRKDASIEVSAGQRLGTVGGRQGQYALDFGVYDLRKTAESVANPERWSQSWVTHAFCPFDYYEEGDVLDGLVNLIERDLWFADAAPCATVFQDVPWRRGLCPRRGQSFIFESRNRRSNLHFSNSHLPRSSGDGVPGTQYETREACRRTQ
jgi:hypothetical protein